MVKKKVTVKSKAGLHLRPARDLCKKAMEFESTQIMIHFREKEFNAKSMLGILSACVQQMDEIEVVCSGAEEEEAAAAIQQLLETELSGNEWLFCATEKNAMDIYRKAAIGTEGSSLLTHMGAGLLWPVNI